MTTTLYTAPAASGKTHFALNIAIEATQLAQHQVRICVPTYLQARAWRQRIARAGGAIGIHILTFDGLVTTCLQTAGEAYTELSDPIQFRLLRKVIDTLPLSHYDSLRRKPGFIQILQQLFAELKASQIDPVQFRETVGTTTLRLIELADIYEAYQHTLQTQGWADHTGLNWLAVESLHERAPQVGTDWPLLIIDGFDDFPPVQLALLQILTQRVGQMVITLPQPDDEQVTFPRYNQTLRRVQAALGVTAEPLPSSDNPLPIHPAFIYLRQHLFSPQHADKLPAAEAVTLIEAPDRAGEARAALRWLKKQMVENDLSPNDVALIARNITTYHPFIRQTAAEFGIPIQLFNGRSLIQSPVIAALLDLLRLHLPHVSATGPYLPRRLVVGAWRSPYFEWGKGEQAITASDADQLDWLARSQRVIGGLTQWEEAFESQLNINKDETHEDHLVKPVLSPEAAQLLEQKFQHFRERSQPPTKATTMRAFVIWLEQLIGPDPELTHPANLAIENTEEASSSLNIISQVRDAPDNEDDDVAALRTLKDVLRGIVWAEVPMGQDKAVDYLTFFQELVGAMETITYRPPVSQGQSALLVANAGQVRGLSFTAVAALGLAEGEFPTTIREDPFLRDQDRADINAHLVRLGHPDFFQPILLPSTQSSEREFFYETVTRPQQALLLTRPCLADNGADWVASPFWEAMMTLIDAKLERVTSESRPQLAEAASWPELWEAVTKQNELPWLAEQNKTAIWRAIERASQILLVRIQQKKSPFDGTITEVVTDLQSQFGLSHTWSASQLENYQTCGFFFFISNVLRFQPRPEPAEGLDTRQIGSLYHEIFENLYEKPVPETIDEPNVNEWVNSVAIPILDKAPVKLGFRQTPWWEKTRNEIVGTIIRSIILLHASPIAETRTEEKFRLQLNNPGGGDALTLFGVIDRIDVLEDGNSRLIDYKLGGKSSFKKKDLETGKKLQLPLYTKAARDTLGYRELEDSYYWHYTKAEPSDFTLSKAEGGVDGAIETGVGFAWEIVHHIRDGYFQPLPPENGCPDYCPAAAYCWQYQPSSFRS